MLRRAYCFQILDSVVGGVPVDVVDVIPLRDFPVVFPPYNPVFIVLDALFHHAAVSVVIRFHFQPPPLCE
jgi:hypothetical protein